MGEIIKNHEQFKSSTDLAEKLSLAMKNAKIQYDNAKNAIFDISKMAKDAGYKLNEKTGNYETTTGKSSD